MRLLAFGILLAASLLAQQTAAIHGLVRDEFGNPAPDAAIKLISKQVLVAETRTADDGTFRVESLPPGIYQISAVKLGLEIPNRLHLDPLLAGDDQAVEVVMRVVRSHDTPTRIPVVASVQHARRIRDGMPNYPQELITAGVSGRVTVHIIIDEEGVPSAVVQNDEADPRLVLLAIAAVEQWRYRTTARNGVPVQVETALRFNFSSVTGQVLLETPIP